MVSGILIGLTGFATAIAVVGAVMLFLATGRILPGVSVSGIHLGGMLPDEAANALSGQDQITITTESGSYLFSLAALNLQIDGARTAESAAAIGRSRGDFFSALFSGDEVQPLYTVRDPLPAGVDSAQVIEKVTAALRSPITLNLYDPVKNEARTWQLAPESIAPMLTTIATDNGIGLTIDSTQVDTLLKNPPDDVRGWLSDNFIAQERNIGALKGAVEGGGTQVNVQVMHPDRTYTVQAGDTLGGLAWEFGIPYWKIQAANGGAGLGSLSAGQTVTIPSPDVMLPLPPVANKRVIVNISQQNMKVYEEGALKWNWAASTGISSSPTTPGIYQITSHDGTAYASVWNLTMPSFMSIYESVPGFFNGIHGFPSRNGSQILWTNALGSKVTYGCVLLSSTNAAALYDWAEDGVIVEIQP